MAKYGQVLEWSTMQVSDWHRSCFTDPQRFSNSNLSPEHHAFLREMAEMRVQFPSMFDFMKFMLESRHDLSSAQPAYDFRLTLLTSLWIHFLVVLDSMAVYRSSSIEIGASSSNIVIASDAMVQTGTEETDNVGPDLLDLDLAAPPTAESDLLDLHHVSSSAHVQDMQDDGLAEVFTAAAPLAGMSFPMEVSWFNVIRTGEQRATIPLTVFAQIQTQRRIIAEATSELGRLLDWLQFSEGPGEAACTGVQTDLPPAQQAGTGTPLMNYYIGD